MSWLSELSGVLVHYTISCLPFFHLKFKHFLQSFASLRIFHFKLRHVLAQWHIRSVMKLAFAATGINSSGTLRLVSYLWSILLLLSCNRISCHISFVVFGLSIYSIVHALQITSLFERKSIICVLIWSPFITGRVGLGYTSTLLKKLWILKSGQPFLRLRAL